jgi:hypothetical protein
MRTRRGELRRLVAGCLLLTTVACGESPLPPTPAQRHVERELRREFNTRFISVSERLPDTLLVAIRGGRLVRGGSGQVLVSATQHALIARRALELLAPDPANRPAELRWIVVDISNSRRFGPIVLGTGGNRSVHEVASLLIRPATDSAQDRGTVLQGSLTPATPGDTLR